jgi:hypothetical protein
MDTFNNYEKEKKSYILSHAKSCEKGETIEQIKVTHWNPTWVVKNKRNKKALNYVIPQ